MRYLIAVLVPPLAVFRCGKTFQAVVNLVVFTAGIVLTLRGGGVGLVCIAAACVHGVFAVTVCKSDDEAERVGAGQR